MFTWHIGLSLSYIRIPKSIRVMFICCPSCILIFHGQNAVPNPMSSVTTLPMYPSGCVTVTGLYARHISSIPITTKTIETSFLFSVDQKVSNSFDTAKMTYNLTSCEKCSLTTIVNWLSSVVCMQSFDCLWNYHVIGKPISREILVSDRLKGASEQDWI